MTSWCVRETSPLPGSQSIDGKREERSDRNSRRVDRRVDMRQQVAWIRRPICVHPQHYIIHVVRICMRCHTPLIHSYSLFPSMKSALCLDSRWMIVFHFQILEFDTNIPIPFFIVETVDCLLALRFRWTSASLFNPPSKVSCRYWTSTMTEVC